MALHVGKNQYRGINAHLRSVLQHETAGRAGFHTTHIADLTAGDAENFEQSLQICQFHPNTGEEITFNPRRSLRPDLLISQVESSMRSAGSARLEAAAVPTLILSAVESIDYDPCDYITHLKTAELSIQYRGDRSTSNTAGIWL